MWMTIGGHDPPPDMVMLYELAVHLQNVFFIALITDFGLQTDSDHSELAAEKLRHPVWQLRTPEEAREAWEAALKAKQL